MLDNLERMKNAGFSPRVEVELKGKVDEKYFSQFMMLIAQDLNDGTLSPNYLSTLDEGGLQVFMDRLGLQFVDSFIKDPNRWLPDSVTNLLSQRYK